MLTGILLAYIGTQINVPSLYYWACGIMIGLNFIRMCIDIFKAGRDAF